MQKEYCPASVRFFIWFAVTAVVIIALSSYTRYIFAKDYYFYIEAPCDPQSQSCFVRDCDDYCPPNGLDTYRSFYIKAEDFIHCAENSCANICLESETSKLCGEVICDTENGDECSE